MFNVMWKPILLSFLFLQLTLLLPGQDGVSFDALKNVLDDQAIPTYYLAGKLYTGTTTDSFEQGKKVYHYEIESGKIRHHFAYSCSGEIMRDFNYQDGLLHGKITSFFGNGQKYYEDSYRKGRREGRQFGWYRDGSPRYVIDCMGGVEIFRMDYPKPVVNQKDSPSGNKQ